jgi:amino acid transporter
MPLPFRKVSQDQLTALVARYPFVRPVDSVLLLPSGSPDRGFPEPISLAALWIELGFLASIVSFGALVAFSAVNLTVVKHYYIDKGEKNVLNNVILPVIGFALTVWLWFNLSWLTLWVGLIWLAIGFVWLLGVTRGFSRPMPVLDMEEAG